MKLDENGVLSKFSFTSSNSAVKVNEKLIAYGDPFLQDVVTGVENTAAVNAYLNVKIPYGHIQIVKTSEDGVVEGLKFY